MPGPSAIGIVLDLDANGAIRGAKVLGGELEDLQKIAGDSGRAVDDLGKSAGDAAQRMANMIQGLQYLQGQFQGVSDSVKTFAMDASNTAAQFEVAMSQVAVAAGFTGERVKDAGLQQEFEEIRAKVIQVGRDTEFSMTQAADAFTVLKQAGLSANQAMGLIDSTMAFSSASMGTVSLADSADMATLSITALGSTLEDANGNMDRMVKTAIETKFELREFAHLFRSMGSASTVFTQTTEAEFLAVAGALKQTGRTAAQAGNDVQGLARSLGRVTMLFSGDKVMGGEKKMAAAKLLGISKEDILDAQGRYLSLADMVDRIAPKIREAMKESNLGEARAAATLLKFFGSQQAANVFLQAAKYTDQYGKTIGQLAATINDSSGEAKNAQDAFLKTTTGQLQVLAGSWELFMTQIGESLNKLGAPFISVTTEIVNAVTGWIAANPELASTLANVLIVVGAVSGALATLIGLVLAANLAHMALAPMLAASATGMTAGGIAAQFYTATLAPLLSLLGAVLLKTALFSGAAYLVYKAYQTNFGGLRTFIDGWAKDIRGVFDVIGPLLSGKGIETVKWEALSDRAKSLAVTIVTARARIREFVEGVMSGLRPGLAVVSTVVEGLTGIVLTLAEAFGFVVTRTAEATASSDVTSGSLQALGYVIGLVAGGIAVYRAGLALWTVTTKIAVAAQWAWNTASKVGRIGTILFNGVMTLASIAYGAWTAAVGAATLAQGLWNTANVTGRASTVLSTIAQGAATGAAWAYAAAMGALKWSLLTALPAVWAFTAALLANPLTWIILLIGALIVGIIALAVYWDEVSAWMGEKWEGFTDWTRESWDKSKQDFIRGMDAISRAWEATTDFFGDAWDKSVQDFHRGVDALSAWWNELTSGITESITGLGGRMYDAGANVINSLWEGMKSAWTGVTDWLTESAEWISGLWPFSPAKHGPLRARPMDRAGHNVGSYFAQGLTAANPEVQASAVGMTQTVQNAVSVLSQNPAESFGIGSYPLVPSSSLMQVSVDPMPIGQASTRGTSPVLPQPAPQAPQGAQKAETRTITVNATVNTGDFKMSVESLDPASAEKFTRWIAERLSDVVQDELERRNLTS